MHVFMIFSFKLSATSKTSRQNSSREILRNTSTNEHHRRGWKPPLPSLHPHFRFRLQHPRNERWHHVLADDVIRRWWRVVFGRVPDADCINASAAHRRHRLRRGEDESEGKGATRERRRRLMMTSVHSTAHCRPTHWNAFPLNIDFDSPEFTATIFKWTQNSQQVNACCTNRVLVQTCHIMYCTATISTDQIFSASNVAQI